MTWPPRSTSRWEARLRAFLGDRTPTLGFLGEETGAASGRGCEYSLDAGPDRRHRQLRARQFLCAVSLALVTGRRPVLGVIRLSFLDARYSAIDGGGAHSNGHHLEGHHADQLVDAIVALGDFAVGKDAAAKNGLRFEVARRLGSSALRVRMLGSAAIDLAWLAEGRIDASVTLSNNPWDVAAGVVVARETGARVVDVDGSDYRMGSRAMLAAGPALIDQLVAIVLDAERTTHRHV